MFVPAIGALYGDTPLGAAQQNCTYDWANKYLGECVNDEVQLAGLFLGLLSIGFWMFAQIPQIVKNFRAGTAEGLSGVFLADWLAGDITNLIGCILTKQVPTQLYTAIWFCIIDTTMLGQWLYYAKIKNKHKQGKQYVVLPMVGAALIMAASPLVVSSLRSESLSGDMSHPTGRTLLTINSFSSPTQIAGWTIGWISGLMYFTSRIPQIIKNYKRKTTEGLSLIMFLMAILGNVTYACGVLMQSVAGDFIIDHLPWLLGSIGTLFFDFTIFSQFLMFGSSGDKAAANGDDDSKNGRSNGTDIASLENGKRANPHAKRVTETDPLLQ